jgi:hypothetical protein
VAAGGRPPEPFLQLAAQQLAREEPLLKGHSRHDLRIVQSHSRRDHYQFIIIVVSPMHHCRYHAVSAFDRLIHSQQEASSSSPSGAITPGT